MQNKYMVRLLCPRSDMTNGEFGYIWKFSQHVGEVEKEELNG